MKTSPMQVSKNQTRRVTETHLPCVHETPPWLVCIISSGGPHLSIALISVARVNRCLPAW